MGNDMKTVIEMALHSGDDEWKILVKQVMKHFPDEFERFAELVRSDEREKYKWDIHSCGPTCKRYACVFMREAIEAEREACAKEAESWGCDLAAAEIRSRSNT
jgi:hypothetical protein